MELLPRLKKTFDLKEYLRKILPSPKNGIESHSICEIEPEVIEPDYQDTSDESDYELNLTITDRTEGSTNIIDILFKLKIN